MYLNKMRLLKQTKTFLIIKFKLKWNCLLLFGFFKTTLTACTMVLVSETVTPQNKKIGKSADYRRLLVEPYCKQIIAGGTTP